VGDFASGTAEIAPHCKTGVLARPAFFNRPKVGSKKWFQLISRNRFQLAVENSDLLAAKSRKYKTIEPLVISSAIIAKQAESLFLADEKAVDTVGSVMNPSRIAGQCNIAGKFVDLVSKGERLTFLGD